MQTIDFGKFEPGQLIFYGRHIELFNMNPMKFNILIYLMHMEYLNDWLWIIFFGTRQRVLFLKKI